MNLSLWTLIKACLLVLNAMAILHPQRFLKQYNLDKVEGSTGIKHQIAGALTAARFMRVPLIVVNSFVIFVELTFG